MLCYGFLMAVLIGQVVVDAPASGAESSDWAEKAQARALAEFQANQYTIEPRLIAYYQLENERLRDRIQAVNRATRYVWSVTTGTSRSEEFEQVGSTGGLASVPVSGAGMTASGQGSTDLSELRRENLLLKGQLRDSQRLYRQANRVYPAEYSIRHRLAGVGVR